MAWAYKGTITITNNATLLPSTQTNFPVLIKLDSVNSTVTGTNRIKTVANGGAVNNTGVQSGGNAVTMPFDLAFYSDTNLTVKIPWEVESYDGTGGTLWVWVLVASCSLSANLYFGLGDATIATQQNTGSLAPTAVWDANFLDVRHLNVLTGETIAGNTATNHATVTQTTGQIDGGANFAAGSSQYLTANAVHASGGKLTVEAWVKPTLSGVSMTVASMWTSGGGSNNEFILYAGQDSSNRKWTFSVEQSGGTVVTLIPASPSYVDGTRYHVAGVADGSLLHIYVNGVDSGTTVAYDGTIKINSTAGFQLGALNNAGTTYFWNGGLDETRISNINRSVNWLMAEYQSGLAPQTFAAVSLAAFVPATAATLEDHISGGSQSTVTIREVTIGDFN